MTEAEARATTIRNKLDRFTGSSTYKIMIGIVFPFIREITRNAIWIVALHLVAGHLPLQILIPLAIAKTLISAAKNWVSFSKKPLQSKNNKKMWKILGYLAGVIIIASFIAATIFTFTTTISALNASSIFTPTIMQFLTPAVIAITTIITIKDMLQINKGLAMEKSEKDDETYKAAIPYKEFVVALSSCLAVLTFWQWQKWKQITATSALLLAGIIAGGYFGISAIPNANLALLAALFCAISAISVIALGSRRAYQSSRHSETNQGLGIRTELIKHCAGNKVLHNGIEYQATAGTYDSVAPPPEGTHSNISFNSNNGEIKEVNAEKNPIRRKISIWWRKHWRHIASSGAKLSRTVVDIAPMLIICSSISNMNIATTTAIASAVFAAFITNSLVFANSSPPLPTATFTPIKKPNQTRISVKVKIAVIATGITGILVLNEWGNILSLLGSMKLATINSNIAIIALVLITSFCSICCCIAQVIKIYGKDPEEGIKAAIRKTISASITTAKQQNNNWVTSMGNLQEIQKILTRFSKARWGKLEVNRVEELERFDDSISGELKADRPAREVKQDDPQTIASLLIKTKAAVAAVAVAAATKIQGVFRGHLVRQARRVAAVAAATKIQGVFRGHRVRKARAKRGERSGSLDSPSTPKRRRERSGSLDSPSPTGPDQFPYSRGSSDPGPSRSRSANMFYGNCPQPTKSLLTKHFLPSLTSKSAFSPLDRTRSKESARRLF